MNVLVLLLVVFSPNAKQPIVITEDYWFAEPVYRIEADRFVLAKFIKQIADEQCPKWRVRTDPSGFEWRRVVRLAYVQGYVLMEKDYVHQHLMHIKEVRQQVPQYNIRRLQPADVKDESWHKYPTDPDWYNGNVAG